MNEDYSQKETLIGVLLLLLLGVMVCLLGGCKSIQYVPVETTKTEYVTKTDTIIRKDSIWAHDSIMIHEKGDTVWVERWSIRYQDRWRDRVHTDTLMKTDSVMVPYPVEKRLSTWQHFCLDWGKVTTGATIALLILLILWALKTTRIKL
jgi:hypothetical protein